MPPIAGIVTPKIVKDVTQVTLGLARQSEAVSTPRHLNLREKSQFEKECEEGESLESLRDFMYQKIDEKAWPQ